MTAYTLTLPQTDRPIVLPPESTMAFFAELDFLLENVRTAKQMGLYQHPDVQAALTDVEREVLRRI